MFVISSTYTRPLERGESVVTQHLAFLDQCYDAGRFIASGPRRPFTGGLIIARGDDENEVRALMGNDPMVRAGVAHYDYLHFHPSRAVHPDLVES